MIVDQARPEHRDSSFSGAEVGLNGVLDEAVALAPGEARRWRVLPGAVRGVARLDTRVELPGNVLPTLEVQDIAAFVAPR